jgi:putative selenium metabolism protein SsnA
MYLILGGNVLTRDPAGPFIRNGAVLTDGPIIKAVGPEGALRTAYPEAEAIDARGGIIMPGFINAHTHLYTAMLRGLTIPDLKPSGLPELLSRKSWRFDSVLDFKSSAYSFLLGAADSIRNGVTTVFDHHASSSCVTGVLTAEAGILSDAGLRSCICFETSGRAGSACFYKQLRENSEFIDFCAGAGTGLVRPLYGLHAPFTLSDSELFAAVKSNAGRAGFHIHVSESADDMNLSLYHYGKSPVGRLRECGVLSDRAVLVHCVHTAPDELDMIARSGASVVTAPLSNMLNAVGTADVFEMLSRGIRVCLGSDGVISSMPELARELIAAARMRTELAYAGFDEAVEILFENNAALASKVFGSDIGVLREGALADVIVMDYTPPSVFDETTADAHIIFGMSGRDCSMTMVNGRVLMLDRKLISIDGEDLKRAAEESKEVWKRFSERGRFEWPRKNGDF